MMTGMRMINDDVTQFMIPVRRHVAIYLSLLVKSSIYGCVLTVWRFSVNFLKSVGRNSMLLSILGI